MVPRELVVKNLPSPSAPSTSSTDAHVVGFQVIEGINDIFQTIHVVSVDVPVSQIAVGFILQIAHVFGDNVPRNFFQLMLFNATLKQSIFDFAEDL